jgi:hypothetical protein
MHENGKENEKVLLSLVPGLSSSREIGTRFLTTTTTWVLSCRRHGRPGLETHLGFDAVLSARPGHSSYPRKVSLASFYSSQRRVAKILTISATRRRCNTTGTPRFVPVGIALGTEPQLETSTFASFTLDPTNPLATIDYGAERAGYPYFVVSSLSEPAQVEVKYSEPFTGLASPLSDGPYAFANALANTFRVETFNFTGPGTVTSSLIQGGQRWQSMRLLTSGTVTFAKVGFQATTSTLEPEGLPGRFSSDNETLNEIWKLGARAATVACVDKGSQGAIWNVDPVLGVYARSVRPALSDRAVGFENYTLEFDTMIKRGGTWWNVVRLPSCSPMSPSRYVLAPVYHRPPSLTKARRAP